MDAAKRRVIKVRAFGYSDIRTAKEISPFGIDSNPIKNMRAVYAETSSKGDRVIVGYLIPNQLADVGETRLFSTDSDGNLKTYFWLKKDGSIEIGAAANHMTQFEALQTAFNKLRDDFNQHVHSSNGTPPTIQSTADMSGAKITNVKTF